MTAYEKIYNKLEELGNEVVAIKTCIKGYNGKDGMVSKLDNVDERLVLVEKECAQKASKIPYILSACGIVLAGISAIVVALKIFL